MALKNKTDSKYKKITQREHVLLRKNMYCGSTNTESLEMYVAKLDTENNISIKKEITKYNPAFIKLFDEIISNASDLSIKYNTVSYVKIDIDKQNNIISIENDCGKNSIPVKKQLDEHSKQMIWIPELLFGNLLSSENYSDDERMGAGQNGVGSTIVNILSKEFLVEVADGKKLYKQTFKNNLSIIEEPKITNSTKNYVKITYKPDFSHFNGIDSIDDDSMSLFLKRTVDLSVYNPKVKFIFNEIVIKISNIKDWMKMHLKNETEIFIDDTNDKWIYGVAKSPTEQFEQVSIASSVSTYRGGTHTNYISLNLSKVIADTFSKKIKANWVDVKNKMIIFLIAKIPNTTFDSQTKECLTNTITKELANNFKVSDLIIKKIMKSEIVESILYAIELKEKDELRKLQKSQQKVKIDKLIDANSKDRNKCQIFIFEGQSAGGASRQYRDPQTQGFYLLKGKFANISKMTDKEILLNEEVIGLMNSIGLELNKKVNIKNLRYGEIFITTDMDTDGDSIVGLLLNFFSRWKELFDNNMIFRILSPLLVITKGKDFKHFYTEDEWIQYQKNNSVIGWNVSFKKGLGSLSGLEYSNMIKNPKKMKLNWDENSEKNLNAWFGEDVNLRKELLS